MIEKWPQASEKFAKYVKELYELQTLDISAAARRLLTDDEKYNVT